MRSALLYGAGENNNVFSPSSHLNRDNCNHPFLLLREELTKLCIDLNTWDITPKTKPTIEIHINARAITRADSVKYYLLNMETPLIDKNNGIPALVNQFDTIFCWSNHTETQNRFQKINYSQSLVLPEITGFSNRDVLCCMIAGNKTTLSPDIRSLYPERIKAITWFQDNYPASFELYGTGWNLPAMRYGKVGRAITKLQGKLAHYAHYIFFPSYKGRVETKSSVLKKSRFNICYENVTGFNGYITEKIFDSFFSGCVPIYYGAPDIQDFIPENCYINKAHFSNYQELYDYINFMPEKEYINYQNNIYAFLSSEQFKPFSSEYFAQCIADVIKKDLESEN